MERAAHWWNHLPDGYGQLSDETELSRAYPLQLLASAAADRVMAGALGLLLSGAMVPRVLAARQFQRERERLAFYRGFADRGDPDASFVRPPRDVAVRQMRRPHMQYVPRDIPHRRLAFDSPYQPLNPELRNAWPRYRRNRIAHALHLYHEDGPRPTLMFLHGFTASSYRLNANWFALPWFHRQGYDVLLVTLPFHGARRDPLHPYSGYGYVHGGFSHLNESVLQSVFDARIWLDWLLARGAGCVGVSGLSLGGYVTSALAAVEDRLAFAIPNSPVVSLIDMSREWIPSGALLDWLRRRHRAPLTELRHGVALHSPLTYAPRLPPERRLIIGGAADRFTAPRFVRLLHEHWRGSELHWFPGNHLLHFQQRAYLKLMRRFMDRCTGSSSTPLSS